MTHVSKVTRVKGDTPQHLVTDTPVFTNTHNNYSQKHTLFVNIFQRLQRPYNNGIWSHMASRASKHHESIWVVLSHTFQRLDRLQKSTLDFQWNAWQTNLIVVIICHFVWTLATPWINTLHTPLSHTASFRSAVVILVSSSMVSSQQVLGRPFLLFPPITPSMIDFSNESTCARHGQSMIVFVWRSWLRMIILVRFNPGLCLWLLQCIGCIIIVVSGTTILLSA